MLTPLIAILALQSAAATEPKPVCTADGYCTVPEFSRGYGMKSNSPPPVMVTVQTPPPAPSECKPRVPCTSSSGMGGGIATNVLAPEPLIVMHSQLPSLPLAVPTEPRLGTGRHELVVHWPETKVDRDYKRKFQTGAACLQARAAILDEHRRRTSAIAVNMANRGTILAMMLAA